MIFARDLSELPLAPGAIEKVAVSAMGNVFLSGVDMASGVLTHVRRIAAATPDRPAIVDEDATVTYAGLALAAAHIQGALDATTYERGDTVAVVGPRSAQTITAFLALEGAGAVYVPLDSAWPKERLAEALSISQARILLAYCHHADSKGCDCDLEDLSGIQPDVQVLRLLSMGETNRRSTHPADLYDQTLETRCCIFTSGSTGRPKGVLVEHRGMMNHLWAKVAALGLNARDRVAFTAPPGFVIAFWQMLAPLLVGGTVVVVREYHSVPPRRLMGRLEQACVTVIEQVPTVISWMADEADRSDERRLDHLRWLISTGQELPTALAGRAMAAFPHARLLNAYGCTEVSDDVTHYEVTDADVGRARLPVGTPINNARLYVLVYETEADVWRAAGPGEAGEIFVGGAVVGLGYARSNGQLPATFFRDPFDMRSPTGRLYRTGDLVVVDGEEIHYIGRVDRQVKLSGIRIEPGEIEAVLQRHPAVFEAAVLIRHVANGPVLAAYFTAHQPVHVADLRRSLTASLPTPMIPPLLVQVEALPLNANGKTDYQALSQWP